MNLHDYFEFINDTQIRIKGHRIYIDDVLEEYLRYKSPEELLYRFHTLNLEKIHAVILYYEANREEVEAYLLRVRQYREEAYQKWLATEGSSPRIVELRQRLKKYRQKLIAEGKRRLEPLEPL